MIWQSCHWQGIILLQIVLSAGGGVVESKSAEDCDRSKNGII